MSLMSVVRLLVKRRLGILVITLVAFIILKGLRHEDCVG